MKLKTKNVKNEKVKKRSLVKYFYLLLAFIIVLFFGSCENDQETSPVNQAPTANAGSNDTIKQPVNSYTFNGSGEDSDGTIASYAWTCIIKPDGATEPVFDDATKHNPTVSGLNKVGDYTFQLIVTDNEGKASIPSKVKITVTAADLITVTQNVNVSFPSFKPGTVLDFTQNEYTPENGVWKAHFSVTDLEKIIYIVTVVGPNNFTQTYNSETGFVANVIIDGYLNMNTYTFTQTFKMNDVVIGNQIIKTDIVFGAAFGALKNINDILFDPQVIPSVLLTLSKQVQP